MSDDLVLEELDLSCEALALTQIEDTLELLDCKLTQISVEGRISRAEASALVERYAVQFDERYPLASFTQYPSATNLTVAQEGIIKSVGKALADLIKKAGEILKKVFLWILKLFDFRSGKDSQATNRSSNIKTVSEAHDELRTNGIKASDDRLEQLKKMVERYNDRYNGLTHDMLTSGRFLKLIKALQPHVLTIETSIKHRLEHLRHVLTILPTDPKDDASFEANAKDMLKSTIPNSIMPMLKQAGITRSEDAVRTARDVMQVLETEISMCRVHEVSGPLDINAAIRLVNTEHNHLAEPVLPEAVLDRKKIEAYMRELNTLRVPAQASCTWPARMIVSRLTSQVVDEVLALKTYISVVNLYTTERDRLLTSLWEFVMGTYQAAYTAGMADTDEGKRQAVKRVTARMRSRMK